MSAAQLAVFLQALALVESGGNPRAVGSAGERGAFQLTPAVAASAGGYCARAAEREVRRIEAALTRMGVDPLPFNVYLAYNAGLGAVRRGDAPVVTYQRAQRLCNVMAALQQEAGKR
ncbi:MAG: Transglycosylase domain [Pseudomonadota bacterium]